MFYRAVNDIETLIRIVILPGVTILDGHTGAFHNFLLRECVQLLIIKWASCMLSFTGQSCHKIAPACEIVLSLYVDVLRSLPRKSSVLDMFFAQGGEIAASDALSIFAFVSPKHLVS